MQKFLRSGSTAILFAVLCFFGSIIFLMQLGLARHDNYEAKRRNASSGSPHSIPHERSNNCGFEAARSEYRKVNARIFLPSNTESFYLHQRIIPKLRGNYN